MEVNQNMEKLKNNTCLNELSKETAAAKCHSSEFIAAMSAVILINVENEKSSVNESFNNVYTEMIEIDCSENENAGQRLLINQDCLFDGEMLLIIDEIFVI